MYNDIFSLNYVYEFSREGKMKTTPYGIWYLERLKAPTLNLYRQMSPKELILWKNKEFDKLGSNWGHGFLVVHFSTAEDYTTAAGPKNNPLIKIEVQKDALIQLAHARMLWSGALKYGDLTSEFVLPADVLKELEHRGLLRIIP